MPVYFCEVGRYPEKIFIEDVRVGDPDSMVDRIDRKFANLRSKGWLVSSEYNSALWELKCSKHQPTVAWV